MSIGELSVPRPMGHAALTFAREYCRAIGVAVGLSSARSLNVPPATRIELPEGVLAAAAWEIVLEDGARFPGTVFGASQLVAGEVVFATGMGGYVESLTDPSYHGQILVLTYPLQGNYGVASAAKSRFQSSRIQVQALVVPSAARNPSHHDCERSLPKWLQDEDVCAIEGVDTRALTKHLRKHGTLRGWALPSGLGGKELDRAKASARAVSSNDLARRAAVDEVRIYEAGPARVLVVDSGLKEGIVRELLARGLSVVRVPFYANLRKLVEVHAATGIVLGNGPGDPKDLPEYVDAVRHLVSGERPILGVCLGCQSSPSPAVATRTSCLTATDRRTNR